MPSHDELVDRVSYHPPGPEAIEKHQDIRKMILDAMCTVNEIVPPGREQSLALTKLEEVMFWSNAGIARNQDVD